MTRWLASVCCTVLVCGSARAAEPPANTWVQVSENAVGPRYSPGLCWSVDLNRFVLLGGRISHAFKGERPYDVQTFDPEKRQWFNHLPAEAAKRGGETGSVTDPGYKSPYFAMEDKEGLVAPNRRQMVLWHQYALAPWDGCIYALVCGRTLKYDPRARTWANMAPKGGPSPEVRGYKSGLAWAAMCADPVNREIVLFGGCGLFTERAGPGTWVYSTGKNTWRELKPAVQPPVRALSPMVYDAGAKKIVLFGGDRLDQLCADTWVYDCATRTWEERKPKVSPAPRFGHSLLFLPKSQKVVLVGGKGYRYSISYQARLYQPLPFEVWTYDVAANTWGLVQRMEEGAPPQISTAAGVAAADDDDTILLVGAGTKRRSPHSSWIGAVDPSAVNAAATAEHGVPPGTVTTRKQSYNPDWYTKDVPPPDAEAQAKLLNDLPANKWVALKAPKWPVNRMGGGWSTVTLDTKRGRILHLGGGHSSYCGNDVAVYDIATGRWSISYAPQFPLEFNYDLSGPGPFALNRGPWGNHNYHAYTYDPTCDRLVYMKFRTDLYNPETKSWPFEEKIKTPFPISKYTTYIVSTPTGVVAWTHVGHQRCGLFRFEEGARWVKLPLTGTLPVTVTDAAAAAYDAKRDRLVMVTTRNRRAETGEGQVWTYDFKTGAVKAMNPPNKDAVKVGRFAREAVYLPKADLVMFGYLLKDGERTVVPFYDCEKNIWLGAEMAGSAFINRRGAPGSSVDLGLVYDPDRDLVWGVLCRLAPGALNVLRVDRDALDLKPLATR